jgi:hypothetical protein
MPARPSMDGGRLVRDVHTRAHLRVPSPMCTVGGFPSIRRLFTTDGSVAGGVRLKEVHKLA